MVIPISVSNDTMFPPYKFDLNKYIDDCKALYGVPPRPHWVTTYFGGQVRNSFTFFSVLVLTYPNSLNVIIA